MAYAVRTAFGTLNNIDAAGAASMFTNLISDFLKDYWHGTQYFLLLQL